MTSTSIHGLTSEEAAALREAGRGNRQPKSKEGGAGEILRRNVLTLFNLLNVILALLLLETGSYRNMLFMGVVVSNALIGTIQELRAKRTHDRLQLLSRSQVSVLRDGREVQLPPDELVEGDVVLLRRGDQVPADGEVLEGEALADESILTGESEKIPKKQGDTVYSGSYLVEGRLTLCLTAVGSQSYMGRMQASARQVKRAKSELMTDMNRIIRWVSAVIVPVGLLLYWKQTSVLGMVHSEAVVKTVASVIGMIPEGLMLLTSVSLAAGVVTLGRKKTLVNELYGIESLARVDVICVDKTGTLTSGHMALEQLIPAPGVSEDRVRDLLASFLCGMGADGSTAAALTAACPPRAAFRCLETVPFSSQRKWSLAVLEGVGSVILGAPERLLSGDALTQAQDLAAQGLRVLALMESPDLPGIQDGDAQLPAHRKPLALLCLCDELRPQVRQTVEYFGREGVQLKVISGDSPLTVSSVAKRAGIPGAEKQIDLSQLDGEKDYTALSREYTVFGRVSPNDKRELIRALQRDGHGVAMVGDGVNDIPALKTADCSLAMAGGSDAACRVAQMTLLSGGFDAMPQILLEGRRVINNITRAASLFLVKNLYSMLLSLALLFLPFAYPFAPIQLTLISTLTIGAPSFILALQPSREKTKGRFLENILLRALPGGICTAALLLAALCLREPLGLAAAQESTLCTVAAAASGLVTLALTCLPFQWLRVCVVALMTIGMALGMLCFPKLFYLTPLDRDVWLIVAGLCASALPLQLMLSALVKRLEHIFRRQKKAPEETHSSETSLFP